MTRILVITDTDGKIPKLDSVNDIDAILVGGDVGDAKIQRQLAFEGLSNTKANQRKAYTLQISTAKKVLRYLAKIAPVYVVFGNAEYSVDDTRWLSSFLGRKIPSTYKEYSGLKNVRVINNKVANIQGIRVLGIPYFLDVCWVKEFGAKKYAAIMPDARQDTKKIRSVLDKAGAVDIVLSHQPLYGVLDTVKNKKIPKSWNGKHGGSKAVLAYVKKYSPQYFFCGHIEEAKGKIKLGKTIVENLGDSGYRIVEF
jgi:Icc-related predicted phosphoesterase